MSAFKARKPRDAYGTADDVRPSSRVRLADGADLSVSSGAHALQAQLKAGLRTGPAPDDQTSPARGVLIALVPSALLWWGVISGMRALMHHG